MIESIITLCNIFGAPGMRLYKVGNNIWAHKGFGIQNNTRCNTDFLEKQVWMILNIFCSSYTIKNLISWLYVLKQSKMILCPHWPNNTFWEMISDDFCKYEPMSSSFCSFSSYSHHNSITNRKKRRCYAWDLNPGRKMVSADGSTELLWPTTIADDFHH